MHFHEACNCEACKPQAELFTGEQMRMIVCSICGNKRCPHATNHQNACTNSNAIGQVGSSWEQVKPITENSLRVSDAQVQQAMIFLESADTFIPEIPLRRALEDFLQTIKPTLPEPRDTHMAESLQSRVSPWMQACFGPVISADKKERNHRFFEESTELVQANGMTRSEAHQLVDYTFNRPVGELHQEVGGVMITLAALCLASDIDMHAAGEDELARIWMKMDAIRAKQAGKPKHSPLPSKVDGHPHYADPSQEPPLTGRWHHGQGYLVSGSIRISRWDCDTNPPVEFRDKLLDWMCETLNSAVNAWEASAPDEFDTAMTTPNSELVEALEHYIKHSDGITIGIPVELANALTLGLAVNTAGAEPVAGLNIEKHIKPVGKADPAPSLKVWFGQMPESCGRTNWTAILRGNGENYTIDRSEFPDRVRYAADCVRHIIGELPEKPYILDYKGDLKTPCHLCGGTGEKDGKPCVGLNFKGTVHTGEAATRTVEPFSLLAKKHTGMRVDYSGMLRQARQGLRREPALAEMLRQLGEHMKELGSRWYEGDTAVVDEILQLYCVESDARSKVKSIKPLPSPGGDS